VGRLTEARKKSKKTGTKAEKQVTEQTAPEQSAEPEQPEQSAAQLSEQENPPTEKSAAKPQASVKKKKGTTGSKSSSPKKTEAASPPSEPTDAAKDKKDEFDGFQKYYDESQPSKTVAVESAADSDEKKDEPPPKAPAAKPPVAAPKKGKREKIKLPSSGTADEIFAYLDKQKSNEPVIEQTKLEEDTIAPLSPDTEHLLTGLPDENAGKDFYSFLSNEEYLSESETEESEDLVQLVGFRLKKELFGIEISQVKEITRLSQITLVPNTPDYMLGVINLRGIIMPVIDLKRRLMKNLTEMDDRSRVVIVENGTRTVGLIVESIDDVYQVPLSQIEEPPEEIVNINERYVSGVARTFGPLIVLLNVAGLLARDEA
jgi:purine-binding chemotaxis protein CheW